ncbi:hypothetical protein Tco_1044420 [Tanacetum coccineum]|uniref:Uncharacterized protein n=1 Tax=Tanacetum coccineum TaxID=301880 RepID=A0ABQ5GQK4_9ASTR
MSFLTSIYSLGNIMDEVDIEDLTIEQYLRLTRESQTPKKIEDMTIAEYLEYEKMVNEKNISNTKSYLPTYFSKSTPTYDPIREFAHYLDPNQSDAESDCNSEDMEEEVEHMTDDEVVISKEEESNHGYTQHFEEKDDVDEWLNAEITKYMSMQGVENMKDALISIIKPIRQEMKDGIMKKQFETSTTSVCDEVSSIANNEVDRADNNTPPCRLPKELSLGIFGVNEQGSLRMWICFCDHERQTVKRSYIGVADFIQVRHGQQNIDDTTRERRIGHNNLHESNREFIFNEWILDSYDVEEEYAKEIGDPYSKRFDEYNRVFKNEIEHLSNEYILRIGNKGYALDDV